ncbi:MAG: hypothetical protein A2271_04155 [Candidatus Moranbacteria bacterium RIFOXYA12_FULL_35_19]|nr:MAG: Foldase protein PrsA [Candidatus Moranbacteria bacterium GW2011_GWF2_35_39]OGI32183.1 MAG: hypothetical protein A2489_01280 [Candidatus Moranbacteria bacterium RIFOXYC12_FULL_36_13]OGI32233.1 MAG: hypothetical protein A2343_03490 [Candidatus Moranbacteria bacterium RIFOXYB12_FULL_35_8]OGI36875.1 MAG: hypothetical protein A2271_04155 [Candidatus Moranbacteria bacterium RIFOXYA12_FULL_35_19]
MNNKKRIKFITILGAFLILFFVYLILVGTVVYLWPKKENKIIQKTVSVIPYPAVIHKAGFITLEKLDYQLLAARKFYESQDFSRVGLRVDFSTPDGQKRLAIKKKNILSKLIEDSIIKAEAKKRGILVTQELVDQEVDRKLKEYGTGNQLKDFLEKFYGWDIQDFKENIVKPDLYQEKLFSQLKKDDPTYLEAREKIEKAQKDLTEKISFSETAKKYSQGESAKNGGALGWFSANQMLPEVAQVVSKLQKNQLSEIVESSIGFHIIQMEDVKEQNGEQIFKLNQIFVPIKSFAQWLSEMEGDYKIFIPSREFYWDSQAGKVQFSEQNMREYEQDLLKNPINDPSIIF